MSEELPAGDFTAWVDDMRGALRGERDSDVPCAGCTACCTSSQFIHISPDETDTLAHIPGDLLFQAPRLPRGHVVMGYDQHGHCPMLVDSVCTIYEHRPRTCRTYDCRVFTATGLQVEAHRPSIEKRVEQWRFSHPTPADDQLHSAVRAAATYLGAHRDALPDGSVPTNPTQLAAVAIELHEYFLDSAEPAVDVVRVELTRRIERSKNVRADAPPARRSGRQSAPRATSQPSTRRSRGGPA